MSKVGFFRELGVGLALAILSGVLITWFSLSVAVGFSCFVYALFLVCRSSANSGKFALLFSIGLVFTLSFVFISSLLAFFVVCIGLVWLARNTLFFSGVFYAMGDLLLIAISFLFSAWAILETHSVFVAVWCFFMALAVGGCLFQELTPINNKSAGNDFQINANNKFQRAYKAAELALKRVVTH